MITAEDYNVALRHKSRIIKVKSVNRNVWNFILIQKTLQENILHKLIWKRWCNLQKDDDLRTNLILPPQTDIESAITNVIEPTIRDRKILNYYSFNFTKIITADLNAEWVSSTQDTNRSTGYVTDADAKVIKLVLYG